MNILYNKIGGPARVAYGFVLSSIFCITLQVTHSGLGGYINAKINK